MESTEEAHAAFELLRGMLRLRGRHGRSGGQRRRRRRRDAAARLYLYLESHIYSKELPVELLCL